MEPRSFDVPELGGSFNVTPLGAALAALLVGCPARTVPASPASAAVSADDCSASVVELRDGVTTAYRYGRSVLYDDEPAARWANASRLRYPARKPRLNILAYAGDDEASGHILVSLADLAEPTRVPATFTNGYVLVTAKGASEKSATPVVDVTIELTRLGAEGGWVEGSFVKDSASGTPVLSGRFRVCRLRDFDVD